MKKKTNKKTVKNIDMAASKKTTRKTKVSAVAKKEKKPTRGIVPRKASSKSGLKIERKSRAGATRSDSLKKGGRKAVGPTAISLGESVASGFGKRASLRISSEFAIAIIFIIAGAFAYIFWKDSSSQMLISNESSTQDAKKQKNGGLDGGNAQNDKLKLFRNSTLGNEFNLPYDWKYIAEEKKFVSEDAAEEVVIKSEEAAKDLEAEDLLKIVKSEDENLDVKLLENQKGVAFEEIDGDIVRKTAKMMLNGYLVTVTYSTLGSENSEGFFEEVVASFREV